VEGKLDMRGEDFQVIVDSLKPLSLDNILKAANENGLFDPTEHIVGVPPLRGEEKVEEEAVAGVEGGEVAAGPYIIRLEEGTDPDVLKN
jgi:hypothetical protein